MMILGLNAYHADTAACLLENGRVVVAIEEERITRIKHAAGFPEGAVRRCLEIAGAQLEDVDHVVLNRDSRVGRWNRVAYLLRYWPAPSYVISRLRNRQSWAGVGERLSQMGRFRGQVHGVEHHLAHLASAFLPSPFERAVAVSMDGFGDFASASWGLGTGTRIAVDQRIHFPHSIGIFYQAITQYLGFWRYGDEYKVMGLAAHGQPNLTADLTKVVSPGRNGQYRLNLDYFRHHRENVPYQWDQGEPKIGALFSPQLEALLGPARGPDEEITERHANIAASAQAVYEECLFSLLRHLAERYGEDRLVLAGGCAQNSLANGKILTETPFKDIYIPAAAADAGGALGAAFHLWYRDHPEAPRPKTNMAYLGDRQGEREIHQAITKVETELTTANCRVSPALMQSELADKAAELLSNGAVIGWFQGAMEWGPRALGNRSILADPRRDNMRELLNAKIKLREPFRPFSPSVLEERLTDWFEDMGPRESHCCFMSHVVPVRDDRRDQIPAVVHVDGTARPQGVCADDNPRYRALIEAFDKRTGVPMILNTSFNLDEPIVRTPEDALNCFLRTGLDALAIGPFLIQRD